ncbi:hypothetical protein DL770_003004 [Monosporascus sp. CRB-9-2]|nr:hypothetical protein DL770_003004 [Monosporascus sp. CRB-9-2]
MHLDDESPNSAGERHMQFLDGHQYPFANRWLEQPVRLAMAANGLSAAIYEHAKLDDIHPYHFRERTRRLSPIVMQRIEQIQTLGRSYGLMVHQYVKAEDLSLSCTRNHHAPPEAIAHLTVLPPRHLSEIVALATCARHLLD